VTNPTAVKHLREMKAGTKWIFYHTGDERTAVGTGAVVSVDLPTESAGGAGEAGKRLKHPKTLVTSSPNRYLPNLRSSSSAVSASFR